MIFDVDRAKYLIEQATAEGTAIPTTKEEIFHKLAWLPVYDEDKLINNMDPKEASELHDWAWSAVVFEMKDLDFCIADDDGEILLVAGVRCSDAWDQHIKLKEIDNNAEWFETAEQMWEYSGTKTVDELKTELETMGGTYNKELDPFNY